MNIFFQDLASQVLKQKGKSSPLTCPNALRQVLDLIGLGIPSLELNLTHLGNYLTFQVFKLKTWVFVASFLPWLTNEVSLCDFWKIIGFNTCYRPEPENLQTSCSVVWYLLCFLLGVQSGKDWSCAHDLELQVWSPRMIYCNTWPSSVRNDIFPLPIFNPS